MKFTTLWVLSVTFILGACHQQPIISKALKSYVVNVSTFHKTLHFPGIIQPIREYEITTPMGAVVQTIHQHYGQVVKKDQIIFTLSSPELQRQYQEKLTNYLKSKDRYDILHARFQGVQSLWKEGLESRNNYLNEKSNLILARIALMEDLRHLSDLIAKTEEGAQQNLSNLSFAQFDKVRLALNSQHNIICLKAPSAGVLLYPPSEDNGIERINPGRSIKADQVLGLIGDLQGIRIEINVPEIDIGDVKMGMPAMIRGVAFGKRELKGSVVAVNAQALANSDGLPSFIAVIEVPNLSQIQQEWIKVGMSAEIELMIDNRDVLLIPTTAIQPKSGQTLVEVKAPNGDKVSRSVITGEVDGDKVVIVAGLKVGDVVLYE